MMNQLTKRPPPGTIMQMSSVWNDVPLNPEDMTHGVALSFPLLGIKGGKFHYRWRGEDTIIADSRGFAVPAIHVVILQSQKDLTRTFYDGGYVEGENRRPDCWSSDGVKPDDLVPTPVSNLCQTCPNAAWGSGATPAAPRAQACQQRRRVVVVPYWGDGGDLTNEAGGGPMLLSVPPGSITNQLEYGKWLSEQGVGYFAVVTQLNFDQDPAIAFPKLEFSFVQMLTDDESLVVKDLRVSDATTRILTSKINIDGPEVTDGVVPQDGVAQQAQQAQPATAVRPTNRPAQAVSNTGSSVRAPVQQTQPTQQAPLAQAPQAPQQPQKVAQATAPGSPVNPAGGSAVRPVPGARPVQPNPSQATGQPGKPVQPGARPVGQPAQTINAAVQRPAAAPQTQRPVRTQASDPPPAEPVDEAQPTGEVGQRMTAAFDNLMGS